ncbi:WbqC family protein [Actinomadura atramentaria]|uniref:WbqC family protein n=1 Tax=Actinomadura atramentaria TaxID=1990 RepID=UPI00035C3388|nr:WbqC family protein [Actinomadura atramentaria]
MSDAVLVAHQPAYLPWGGYFARLLDVPRLVVLDHVQFSERGFQHRNRVLRAGGGAQWLTVPVRRRFGQPLTDVVPDGRLWARRHFRTLAQNYGRAPCWDSYAQGLDELYARPWERLVDLDLALTGFLLDALGLSVELVRSSSIGPAGARTDMLVDLCRRTGARTLRVGTGATGYLDAAALAAAGIDVEVSTFALPPYPQAGGGPFTDGLSVLDLLLHRGPHARAALAAGAATSRWSALP